MIQVGDIVQHKRTRKIGIVTKQHLDYVDYYNVLFPDGTYTTRTQELEPLEKK
jgi:hypothetical protein